MQTFRYLALALMFTVVGACASGENLDGAPTTSEAGSSSTRVGGASATGGATATGGAKSTGLNTSNGGVTTGTVTGTGGVVGTGTLTAAKGGTTGTYTTTSRVPSCTDKLKNGDETDVDCGGSCETKCAFGKACSAETDCAQIPCAGGICTTCANTVQDGNESDVDCGGSCNKCVEGKKCTARADCATYNCDSVTGTCGVQSNCLAVLESPCTCAENVLNAGDIDKCAAYVTCYLENDCTPTTASCTSNDAVCGVNKVGGGNSPIEAATKVYNCACK